MKTGLPSFHRDTGLARGLVRLLSELERRLDLHEPLAVYLAGGMAVHLYTGSRVTTDVDAEFAGRVAIPNDLCVDVGAPDGTGQLLYLDTSYNPMFALMHEWYQDDAIELELDLPRIRLFVLSPLDLAVSKLARFADNDRADVTALVDAGLVTADDLERRAKEALVGFVGGRSMVVMNIDEAVAAARSAEAAR